MLCVSYMCNVMQDVNVLCVYYFNGNYFDDYLVEWRIVKMFSTKYRN